MSLTSLLNAKCDVYRLSSSVDSMGGINETYSTLKYEQTPCRIRMLRGAEQVDKGAERPVADFRMYFSTGLDIRETDRITNITKFSCGSQKTSDKNNYDVVIADDPNRMGRYAQVDVILRQTSISRTTS